MSVYTDAKITGQKIRELRKKKKWTQADLADAAGLDYTSIGAAERGERNLSLRSLLRVAEALEVDASCFFPASKKMAVRTEKDERIAEILNALEMMDMENVELVMDFAEMVERRGKR